MRDSGTGITPGYTGDETAAAVAEAAAELEAWLGPARITPRFPTPLQKLLAG